MQTFNNIITNLSRLLAVLTTVVVFNTVAISQPSVRMQKITGCSNTEVLIPVEVVNMQNIAALTLFIKVDTNTVEYVGVEDVNAAFAAGDFVGGENQSAQLFTVNWFSLSPASIDSGLICNIRVLLKGNSCDLLFEDDCEFIKPDLSKVEDVDYVNGSILALGSYVPDPLSQTVIEGSDINISLSAIVDGLTLHWQQATDEAWFNLEENATFNGVETTELSINPVSKDMNETRFRCLISNNECSEGTAESELYVTPNTVNNKLDQNYISPLQVYPNPVGNILNCTINSNINNGKVVLTSSGGEVIKVVKLSNVYIGDTKTIEMMDVSTGAYFVSLFDQQKMISTITVIRN